MENYPVQNLIQFTQQEKMSQIQSLLIDMYAKGNIIKTTPQTKDSHLHAIRKEYCYFDTDSYLIEPSYKNRKIIGGPRSRIFNHGRQFYDALLTKSPLCYLKAKDFFYIHYLQPYYKNFNYPLISALLHYKFLPDDIQKYKQIARQGHYAHQSADYKKYLSILKQNPNLSFFYSKSQIYSHSFDLLKINVINQKNCHQFLSGLKHKDTRGPVDNKTWAFKISLVTIAAFRSMFYYPERIVYNNSRMS